MEVALLRRTGQAEEARARLAHWRSADPPSSFLRHEAVLLGAADEALWAHLASDPERVLELAVDYMALGLWDDAHTLLARRFPSIGVAAEPGTALPQDYPLVAYYRGYTGERAGRSGAEDFALASGQSTRYVFPNRPESLVVLRRATEANPGDATARFLLGSLLLSGGQADAALAEWERARALDPRLPVLHRNIGFTHLYARGDAPGGPARLRGGDERRPRERRALPGGRPGAEPPRPRARGADRLVAALPRDPSPVDARLQARPRPRRGRPLRRGGGALPRALLPPRGVRHERPPGLPRGEAAPGLRPRARGTPGGGGGARGDLRPARARASTSRRTA